MSSERRTCKEKRCRWTSRWTPQYVPPAQAGLNYSQRVPKQSAQCGAKQWEPKHQSGDERAVSPFSIVTTRVVNFDRNFTIRDNQQIVQGGKKPSRRFRNIVQCRTQMRQLSECHTGYHIHHSTPPGSDSQSIQCYPNPPIHPSIQLSPNAAEIHPYVQPFHHHQTRLRTHRAPPPPSLRLLSSRWVPASSRLPSPAPTTLRLRRPAGPARVRGRSGPRIVRPASL